MVTEPEIKTRFEMLAPFLNERTRRLAAAAEAASIGRGGISRVARATGVSRRAIASGLAELRAPDDSRSDRIRRAGGGRKRAVELDSTLRSDLERLIDPVTRGDPESPLRWTCKSIRKLAEELERMGHATQPPHGRRAAARAGLQPPGQPQDASRGRATRTANAQFEYINAQGPGRPEGRRAGHLGGCQEEGVGRGLQERRAGVAAGGATGAGAGL